MSVYLVQLAYTSSVRQQCSYHCNWVMAISTRNGVLGNGIETTTTCKEEAGHEPTLVASIIDSPPVGMSMACDNHYSLLKTQFINYTFSCYFSIKLITNIIQLENFNLFFYFICNLNLLETKF